MSIQQSTEQVPTSSQMNTDIFSTTIMQKIRNTMNEGHYNILTTLVKKCQEKSVPDNDILTIAQSLSEYHYTFEDRVNHLLYILTEENYLETINLILENIILEKSCETSYKEYPSITSYKEYPSITSYKEYPSITSYKEYPSITSYKEYPSITSYKEYPSITSYKEYPSITSYKEYPSITSYKEYPSITSYKEYPSITGHEEYSSITSYKEYRFGKNNQDPYTMENTKTFNPTNEQIVQGFIKTLDSTQKKIMLSILNNCNPLQKDKLYFTIIHCIYDNHLESTMTTIITHYIRVCIDDYCNRQELINNIAHLLNQQIDEKLIDEIAKNLPDTQTQQNTTVRNITETSEIDSNKYDILSQDQIDEKLIDEIAENLPDTQTQQNTTVRNITETSEIDSNKYDILSQDQIDEKLIDEIAENLPDTQTQQNTTVRNITETSEIDSNKYDILSQDQIIKKYDIILPQNEIIKFFIKTTTEKNRSIILHLFQYEQMGKYTQILKFIILYCFYDMNLSQSETILLAYFINPIISDNMTFVTLNEAIQTLAETVRKSEPEEELDKIAKDIQQQDTIHENNDQKPQYKIEEKQKEPESSESETDCELNDISNYDKFYKGLNAPQKRLVDDIITTNSSKTQIYYTICYCWNKINAEERKKINYIIEIITKIKYAPYTTEKILTVQIDSLILCLQNTETDTFIDKNTQTKDTTLHIIEEKSFKETNSQSENDKIYNTSNYYKFYNSLHELQKQIIDEIIIKYNARAQIYYIVCYCLYHIKEEKTKKKNIILQIITKMSPNLQNLSKDKFIVTINTVISEIIPDFNQDTQTVETETSMQQAEEFHTFQDYTQTVETETSMQQAEEFHTFQDYTQTVETETSMQQAEEFHTFQDTQTVETYIFFEDKNLHHFNEYIRMFLSNLNKKQFKIIFNILKSCSETDLIKLSVVIQYGINEYMEYKTIFSIVQNMKNFILAGMKLKCFTDIINEVKQQSNYHINKQSILYIIERLKTNSNIFRDILQKYTPNEQYQLIRIILKLDHIKTDPFQFSVSDVLEILQNHINCDKINVRTKYNNEEENQLLKLIEFREENDISKVINIILISHGIVPSQIKDNEILSIPFDTQKIVDIITILYKWNSIIENWKSRIYNTSTYKTKNLTTTSNKDIESILSKWSTRIYNTSTYKTNNLTTTSNKDIESILSKWSTIITQESRTYYPQTTVIEHYNNNNERNKTNKTNQALLQDNYLREAFNTTKLDKNTQPQNIENQRSILSPHLDRDIRHTKTKIYPTNQSKRKKKHNI